MGVARQNGAEFPVYSGRDASSAYGVSGIPRTLILDRKGKVRFDQSGFGSGMEERMAKVIEELLAESE
jgi:hypothetical protein